MLRFSLLKKPKSLLIIVIAGAMLFQSLGYLISIHFKIGYFIEHVLFSWRDTINFTPYKKEYELIVEQAYLFVDNQPSFFEKFARECSATEHGLIFYKRDLKYPESVYHQDIEELGWPEAVQNHYRAFPTSSKYSSEGSIHISSDYIIFNPHLTAGKLVYSKDGKYHKELIDSYWTEYNLVY